MASYDDTAYEDFLVQDSVAMAIETFDCWELLTTSDVFTDSIASVTVEAAAVSSTATLVAGGMATEVATIHSSLTSVYHLTAGLAVESANIASTVFPGWRTDVTEAFSISSLTEQELETVTTEAAVLDDSTSSRTRFTTVLTDSFTIFSELPSKNGATVSETFNVSGQAYDTRRITSLADEAFLVHASVVQLGRPTDTADELAQLHSTATSVLRGSNVVVEQFYIGDYLFNTEFTAWASDLRQLGMTRFTGLKSNALTKIGSTAFGTSADGLQRFSKDVTVQASIKTGKMDFKDDHKKRLEGVFAYGESASPMQVEVTYDKQGEETSREYPFMNRLNDDSRNVRAKVGKGMLSRYYQFTLSNPDGLHFAVRRMFVDAGVTARRL